MSENYYDDANISVTFSKLKELAKRIQKIDERLLFRVFARWREGRAIDAKLDDIEPILIRTDELRNKITGAIRILGERLWEGIFAIRALREKYGTGKTQLAKFLYRSLKDKQDIITYYTSIKNPRDLSNIESLLEEAIKESKNERKIVLFIDEVDVLVDPKLSEEEQRTCIEQFANIIIRYSEYASNIGIPLSIILVISHRADKKINEVSEDRLGRRLTDTLIEADLFLKREDIKQLAMRIALLYIIILRKTNRLDRRIERYKTEFYTIIRNFIEDISTSLWDEPALRGVTIGMAITKIMKLTEFLLEGIDWSNFNDNYRMLLGSPQTVGTRIEKIIRHAFEKLCPTFSFRKDSYELKSKFINTQLEIDGFKCDSYYDIYLGEQTPLGQALIEITTTSNIRSKYSQLKAFLSKAPVLLVYIYPTQQEVIEDLDAFIEELGSDSPNMIFRFIIDQKLIRYALLLSEEYQLRYAREIIDLVHEVKPLLEKISYALFNKWFSLRPTEELATTSPTPPEEQTRQVDISEIKKKLFAGLHSTIIRLQLDERKYKQKDTIVDHLARTINDVLRANNIPITREICQQIAYDIIKSWASKGLGKETQKQFRPYNSKNRRQNPSWDNKKATQIALDEVLASLKLIYVP